MQTHTILKMFLSSLQPVRGPFKSGTSPFLSADGTTRIKNKASITHRQTEHFDSFLNRLSNLDPSALDQIPLQPIYEELNLLTFVEEVKKATKQIDFSKSSSQNEISEEIFKSRNKTAIETFQGISVNIWGKDKMPLEFRDAVIVTLFKNKGSKKVFGNYRGISLLSITGEADMIYLVRQAQGKYIKQNMDQSFCSHRSAKGI